MQHHSRSRPVTGSQGGVLRDRMGETAWQQLVDGAAVVTVVAGGRVDVGDDHVLAVLDGMCRVFVRTPLGRQVTIRYPRSGELVGLISIMTGWRAWDAEAVDALRCARVPGARVRELMATSPDFLRTVAEEVSGASADAINMLVNASSESMSARVAGHLMELATGSDLSGRPTAHVTHQRLADSTGTAREVVTRVLRRFRTAGAVRTGPGTIVILDEQRLFAAVRAEQPSPSG